MRICVHVNMYIYMCLYVHCICAYVYMYVYKCMCICICVYIVYVYMCTCVCICVYVVDVYVVCVYMYMCAYIVCVHVVCACMFYMCVHAYVRVCTCVYIYMYWHMHFVFVYLNYLLSLGYIVSKKGLSYRALLCPQCLEQWLAHTSHVVHFCDWVNFTYSWTYWENDINRNHLAIFDTVNFMQKCMKNFRHKGFTWKNGPNCCTGNWRRAQEETWYCLSQFHLIK